MNASPLAFYHATIHSFPITQPTFSLWLVQWRLCTARDRATSCMALWETQRSLELLVTLLALHQSFENKTLKVLSKLKSRKYIKRHKMLQYLCAFQTFLASQSVFCIWVISEPPGCWHNTLTSLDRWSRYKKIQACCSVSPAYVWSK